MDFVPASPISVAAFLLVLVFVLGAALWAVWRAYGELRAVGIAVVGIGAWLGAISALVGTGVLATLPLGGLPFFFAISVGACAVVGGSRIGGRLAAGVPLVTLVAFQGFRLPLEVILHQWYLDGTIPETMTWSGQNWDVVSGVLAIACAPLAARSRIAAWVANGVGALLLLNVMRVAILSSPLPFSWDVEPPLLLGAHLPYALIVPVCVGGALVGHVVTTRALLTAPPSSEPR